MRRLVVLGLAAVVIGIPVAIAKNGASEPQRAPAAKPAVQKPAAQKRPAAKERANAGHDGQCRDRGFRDADV